MTFELRLTQKSLLIAIFCSLLCVSCKKLSDKEEKTKVEIINPKLIEDFFKPAANENKEIIKIADNWSKQAGFKSELPAFIAKNGYPLWDKAVYNFAGEPTKKLSARVNSESSGISFIPLRDAQSSQIKSYVVCNKHSDSVYSYRLYNRSELLHNIANGNDSLRHASNLTLSLFAHFEKQINGNDSITFNDNSVQKTISVSDFKINQVPSNIAGRSTVYYCAHFYTVNWVSMETINGQTVFQAHSILVGVSCAELISGWDPSHVGTPSSQIDGGGGGVYYYIPSLNGGGGNSSTGWWSYANGYNGVYLEGSWFSYDNLYPYWANYPVSTVLSEEDLILQNLTTNLSLDQTQFNTLKANLNMVAALRNYLLTSPEDTGKKIEKIKEHIDLMGSDANYLSFCQAYTLNGYSLWVWWENEYWLNSNYPGLYSNIQQLKLDAKQAYTLLNFSILNQSVSDLISKNFSDLTMLDKEILVKEFLKEINSNQEFKEFVQSGYVDQANMHPWMATLLKELAMEIGWKIIKKYIPGYGDWQSVKDAIEEAKDGDWLGAVGEALNILKKKIPALAIIDAIIEVAEVTPIAIKTKKIFDKIQRIPENAFQGLLKTLKNKCGGIIDKVEHSDVTDQGIIRYNPADSENFFREIASHIGVGVNPTSSAGVFYFDVGNIRFEYYPQSNPLSGGKPTIKLRSLTSNWEYKIRFE